MWEDHIVETRAAREKLIHEFGKDLDSLWEYLQEVQR
jgi:RNAse (barnase) inhibitor barstar